MMLIAMTLTPIRYKLHMQFLTSVPNFRGGDQLTETLGFLTEGREMYTFCLQSVRFLRGL